MSALASDPLGANGQAINTSSYSIDLYQGPVSAGNRVIGLGGAYVAIAEDVDGDLQNPAAPGVRPFFSIEHFDYWLGLGLTFPGRLSSIDFFNSGSETGFRGSSGKPLFLTPALNLQWGTFGLGLTVELSTFGFENALASAPSMPAESSLEVGLQTYHLQLANAFLDGQFVVGAGLRFLTMSVGAALADGDTQNLFDTSGTGIELGVVFRPNLAPYRLGAAFRSAIDTQPSFSRNLLPNSDGDIVVERNGATLYLPERVSLPWDINVGAAVQLGKRPLNPISRTVDQVTEREALMFRVREIDREEERQRRLAEARSPSEREAVERDLDREERLDVERLARVRADARHALSDSFAEVGRAYLLLSASLLISGRVSNAVGVESFLDQQINRSGADVVLSPRVGGEAEVWENRLKARGGLYLEPTRFTTSQPRAHVTLGMDLRLFRWNVLGLWPDDFMWQVGGSMDIAERYLAWGVSIAGWYPRHHRSETP
ncbi:MAG TPA: hypothetical protein VNN80_20860 [Polyangiaceae bacterium]|jgi:hypothetical protein|nr:hypothetical protein [Polyangiaceae bacterium]